MIVCITTSKGSRHEISCYTDASKPDEDVLEKMYKAWIGNDTGTHSTFDLIPPVYKTRSQPFAQRGQQVKGRESMKVFGQRIYGRAKCRKRLNRRSSNLMEISLCPWYVEMTYDDKRFPDVMANVRCRCTHCYNFDGVKPNATAKTVEAPQCKEIKQLYKVLRLRKNSKGDPICDRNNRTVHTYENSFEEVTIGCTCALRKDRVVKVKGHNYRPPR